MFFPTPTSTSVDPQSVTELDDALFSYDPYAYFCARIESIASDPAPDAYETKVGRAVCAAPVSSPEAELGGSTISPAGAADRYLWLLLEIGDVSVSSAYRLASPPVWKSTKGAAGTLPS